MIRLKKLSIIGTILLFVFQAYGQEEIDLITFNNKIVEVRITNRNKSDSLKITLENSKASIFGSWKHSGLMTIFKPLIPLASEKTFLIYRNHKNTDSFSIKKKKQARPKVLAFYPSADTLPENLLKCYISFSQPMRDNNIYDFITVTDEGGHTIKDVILALEPALWNEDQTILTLWIDPGRVKRDLIRNKNLGIPFRKGRNYSILISQKWKGINGENLPVDFKKSFYIIERDEELPNTKKWKINNPQVGSLQSLNIEFPENMDYRTTLDGIEIYLNNQLIKGTTSLIRKERLWSFKPDSLWQKGKYLIKLDPAIEDNAGNNLIRPFDKDLYQEFNNENINPLEISFVIR